MKTVSARQANHDFSELLSRVERGEEILITKRSKPVALLSPYHPPRLTPERQAAIDHAIEVMAQGLSWGTLILEPHSSTYRFPIALTGLINRSPAASASCRPDRRSGTAGKSTYGTVCCPSKCVLPGRLRSQRGRN